jgi:hypothetical protein
MSGCEVFLEESRMDLGNLPQWEKECSLFSVGETQGIISFCGNVVHASMKHYWLAAYEFNTVS